MKILNVLLACSFLSIAAISRAHEGHEHSAPQSLIAPKGGLIKAMEESVVEVVSKGNNLKIYLYDKELKPQKVNLYTVTARAQKPRAKSTEEITLSDRDIFFEATYDAKGAHRYTLTLSVKDPKENHADTLNFTIEPKK